MKFNEARNLFPPVTQWESMTAEGGFVVHTKNDSLRLNIRYGWDGKPNHAELRRARPAHGPNGGAAWDLVAEWTYRWGAWR